MNQENGVVAWMKGELFQSYIFTVLAVLLGMTILMLAHGDFKAEIETILTALIGGLLGQIGAIVSAIFGNGKNRTAAARQSDTPPTTPTTPTPQPSGA